MLFQVVISKNKEVRLDVDYMVVEVLFFVLRENFAEDVQ